MLFLPPYSPDLNPTEMTFSKFKVHLKVAGMRIFDGFIKKIGDICNTFSPKNASTTLNILNMRQIKPKLLSMILPVFMRFGSERVFFHPNANG